MGSTPTTRKPGFFSLKKRPQPEMVPPVPMPATKTSTSPLVCFQISGAVDV